MRKVTFAVANSLDNYIARSDGSVDWLLAGDESASALAGFWNTIDAVIIGRKTYEPVLRSGDPFPAAPGVRNYVLSRTFTNSPHEGVQMVGEDVVEFVRRLRTERGKGIFVMGGGELARPLIEAGLIDEVWLTIHPVLLGGGVPLFHEMGRQIDLELIECKASANGCVSVTYRVKGQGT